MTVYVMDKKKVNFKKASVETDYNDPIREYVTNEVDIMPVEDAVVTNMEVCTILLLVIRKYKF